MPSLPSGRPEEVADDEILQRAIGSKRQFSSLHQKAKASLLMPSPHIELSVSRISDLSKTEIRSLADKVIGQQKGKPSLGYASLSAAEVREEPLEILPDEVGPAPEQPLLHHANITGWPNDKDPSERKRRQLEIAKRLETKARLILWD